MGIEHSSAAALVDFCDCDDCKKQRGQHVTLAEKPAQPPETKTFTIRTFDFEKLKVHRSELVGLGFKLDPINQSRGWKQDRLPEGMFYTRISGAPSLFEEHWDRLTKWDQEQENRDKEREEYWAGRWIADTCELLVFLESHANHD